jgi:hypothetical protein
MYHTQRRLEKQTILVGNVKEKHASEIGGVYGRIFVNERIQRVIFNGSRYIFNNRYYIGRE